MEEESVRNFCPSTLSLSLANSPLFYYFLRQQFDLKEAVFRVKIYNDKTESLY